MRLFSIVFLGIITLFSCNQDRNPESQKSSSVVFFDLNTFFEKEIQSLSSINSFTKTVTINGRTEEQKLNKLDFENEFSIFTAADINRPAWSDKYAIDSLFNSQNQLTQIRYQAMDAQLKTKTLTIKFLNSKVVSIYIEKNMDNAVATSSQTLYYEVNKGYTIQSQQDLSFSESRNFQIKVDYSPN